MQTHSLFIHKIRIAFGCVGGGFGDAVYTRGIVYVWRCMGNLRAFYLERKAKSGDVDDSVNSVMPEQTLSQWFVGSFLLVVSHCTKYLSVCVIGFALPHSPTGIIVPYFSQSIVGTYIYALAFSLCAFISSTHTHIHTSDEVV